MSRLLKNNTGFVHFLGIVGTLLIIIGAWFVWKEYKRGTLKQSIVVIISDYQQIVTSNVSNPEHKKKIDEGFEKIKNYIRNFDEKPIENAIQNINYNLPSGGQK